MKIEEPESQ